ncbi:hypothetical protein HKD28_02265 [Gluconobacter sp. LMG 1744]|uniref:Uncharacterized protein n=1 Tax=Gluconobacter cadivus TaxID=2728101 RepID=A0ABR9YUH9_9PROT|nr:MULTISPECIES: hypothetical protein [Gluconobacter]MBS1058858.1 hypothetical protein [Gluconobacter sp. Dm-44]MBF0887979.1 hypothetical protein [Gluconobacter cadivus]MBF0890253.1 hypothetical protein [Gluconobacter cadivus]MBS1073397.1 hypothetical protein [Gluconobacter sp. Dm-73]MBS1090186.1 hypothetical protein [Gluconobacter sp. Dm-74]
MPLAFIYAIILVILGALRLLMPEIHGLLMVLAKISAACLVISALVDLWTMRKNVEPATMTEASLTTEGATEA